MAHFNINPNRDRVSREVLPRVVYEFDPTRPYLPSSPYYSEEAYRHGCDERLMTEAHLWGPRGYYKDAYYAEDREYDKKLINIIERYELYKYDSKNKSGSRRSNTDSYARREILKSNGLLYIIARDGDTYKSLSKELGISKRKIRKYNDLYKEYTFKEGDIVWLVGEQESLSSLNSKL
jgi:hypothetical protein